MGPSLVSSWPRAAAPGPAPARTSPGGCRRSAAPWLGTGKDRVRGTEICMGDRVQLRTFAQPRSPGTPRCPLPPKPGQPAGTWGSLQGEAEGAGGRAGRAVSRTAPGAARPRLWEPLWEPRGQLSPEVPIPPGRDRHSQQPGCAGAVLEGLPRCMEKTPQPQGLRWGYCIALHRARWEQLSSKSACLPGRLSQRYT